MGKMTVWYKIDHPDFPHCKNGMVFCGELKDTDAERVARSLYNELLYVLGKDTKVLVWAE